MQTKIKLIQNKKKYSTNFIFFLVQGPTEFKKKHVCKIWSVPYSVSMLPEDAVRIMNLDVSLKD